MRNFHLSSIIAAAGILVLACGSTAQAMPMFAKAYGAKCSLCHTLVPGLNSYGRYVQRTGYASLDPHVLQTVPPVWFGEQINGDSTGGVSNVNPDFKNSIGNLAIHAAGYLGNDWTYHVQSWLLANDTGGGGLDTAWVTYNNLLHRDGHLFLGKIEAPGPSPFSQWFDITQPVTPEIVVGEHGYQLDGNRWGAKFAYTRPGVDAEVSWLGSGGDLISASDFDVAPGTEKTWQWKLANTYADKPLEFGAYGAFGSFIVSTGATDHYNAWAPYVQRDPANGIPGVLAIYQFAHDDNPGLDALGNQLPGVSSHAYSLELYQPLFNDTAVLSAREDMTDDGLGTVAHYHTIDFAFTAPHYQFLHGYFEAGMGANSTHPNGGPTWRWILWWTPPITNVH